MAETGGLPPDGREKCRIPDKDAFSGYHPAIQFLYFGLVLLFSMFFTHPVSLGISLSCALLYHIQLSGGRAAGRHLVCLLPMLLLAAAVNPAFNHRGGTILTYLPSGNPLTLESILYGLAAAGLLAAVVTWFACYSAVMTSDKFVYLFGRVIPALSLVLSMTLRFVPRFTAQFRAVSEAQKSVGRDISGGGVLRRVRTALTVLSVLVTWSLENAIETADSMKSRGYGLPGRTAFSIYRFDARDRAALGWLGLCGGYVFAGWMAGDLSWRYYPTVKGNAITLYSVSIHLAYLLLCLTPVLFNRWADRAWAEAARGGQPCSKV